MTNKAWEKAFDLLMINEGGYVNNKYDSGGQTKYGISQKTYPNLDIKKLTLEQAKRIYKKDYWDVCQCDWIPDALSIALFDFAVNSGVKRAVKSLQAELNVPADGVMGLQTISAANSLPTGKVLKNYIAARAYFLINLPNYQHFGKGWEYRLKRVKNLAEKFL